jgi:hypothetical protein
MRGLWVHQRGTRRECETFANTRKTERRTIVKEGDIFESLLDGTEYVVKNIVNRMVVLKSTKGEREILTEVGTLRTKSFYREKEKKVDR